MSSSPVPPSWSRRHDDRSRPGRWLHRTLPLVVTAGAALWLSAFAGAEPPAEPAGRITTVALTGAVAIDGLAAGPDGNYWATNNLDDHVYRITPGGTVTTFTDSVSKPDGITLGPDGNLWFTNRSGSIGRITPGGTVTAFVNATHIVNPGDIVAGPDGDLWFTDSTGGGTIGRINTDGIITAAFSTGGLSPSKITLGPDGNLWFTSLASNTVARITPAGVVTPFSAVGLDEPFRITAGSDGALWFTLHGGRIGRVTTAGVLSIAADLSPRLVRDITAGSDGNLWFTTANPSSIGRLTTSGQVTYFTHPSVGSPRRIVAGDDAALWFSDAIGPRLGRVAPGSTGQLRVTTQPALPATITIDGVPRDAWGLNWVDLPPASYDVCFGHVPGYTPPPCQQVEVQVGATTTLSGTYLTRGYLQVETVPPVPATIFSSDPDFAPRNNYGLWTDVDPGTYLVCVDEPADWTRTAITTTNGTPWIDGCVIATVTAGQNTKVTANYTSTPGTAEVPGMAGPTGQLRVTTTPAVGTRISIDGTWRDSWGLTWVDLAPGTYEVCFEGVLFATVPDCEPVTVAADAVTTLEAAPIVHGFLRVDTAPAPGFASTITVDSAPANAWGVYNSLAPGTYQVCFWPVLFATEPACQDATVTEGATTVIAGTFTPH